MPSFMVEAYAVDSARTVAEAKAQASRAADLDPAVHYVRTTFLPGDETVLHFFEAPSVEALDRVGRMAELPFHRIVETVDGQELVE
jgi:hypothetical protein